jgi:hypothetical protein
VTTHAAAPHKSDQPSASDVGDGARAGPLDSANRSERAGPEAPGVSGDSVPSGNAGVDTSVSSRLKAMRDHSEQERAKQQQRQNESNQRWEAKMKTRL